MSELNESQCGLSNDHVVKEPISLMNDHCICKQYVPDIQEAKIKCRICSIETDKSKLEINFD